MERFFLGVKQEKLMKKKFEEERDEERVHRQLRELQDDFIRENNPQQKQASNKRDPSPMQSDN